MPSDPSNVTPIRPDQSRPTEKASAWAQVGTVLLALVISIVGGTLTTGVLIGSAKSQIESVVNDNKDYRNTLNVRLENLGNQTQSLAVISSALGAQVDALRKALETERQDRLNDPRRFLPR